MHGEELERYLRSASQLLLETLDYEQTLQQLAQLAVPRLADWCMVDIFSDKEVPDATAIAHVDPAKVTIVREGRRRFPPNPRASGSTWKVLQTGEPELLPEITDEFLRASHASPEYIALARMLGVRSAICVPLTARGRSIGTMTLISAESGRTFTRDDLALAQTLALQAALVVDNAWLYREAQRSVRMREQMLAIVSHDLRSPLSAIALSAGSLEVRAIALAADETSVKHIRIIRQAAGRMAHQLDDLLQVASIQAGRLSVDLRRCSAGALLDEALELHRPFATEKGLQLRREASLEGVEILCDRERLLQVFSNLLGNAIKFCRSGDSITVRGQVTGQEVRFEVADTGPGIEESALSHVFDPYWATKQQAKKGTGLGLFIARGIIETHHGRISVESRVGGGSTFAFRLPLVGH